MTEAKKRNVKPNKKAERKISYGYVFMCIFPDGKKYIDNCVNRHPEDKKYWYYLQMQKGKESPFYDEIRKQFYGNTEALEIKILDFYESNSQSILNDHLNKMTDEMIERHETYKDGVGLNG